MKKSYNPFKMWGSYLGAVLGFIVVFMGMPSIFVGGNLFFILEAVSSIFGFLIGWGIHSLIRKLKH